jgi:TolA-binding protein
MDEEELKKKRAYQDKMEAQLREWNAEIDRLIARVEKAKAQAKIDYYDQLQGLRAQRETAREKLGKLKASSADAWQEMKVGVDKAWSELRTAMSSAMTKFREGSERPAGSEAAPPGRNPPPST